MSVDLLLVDDRMIDAQVTLLALRRISPRLKVLTLKSGEEALEYLFAVGKFAGFPPGKPRAVLLDIEMPVMSGLATLDLLRAHPVTRDIPVIMLSTSAARSAQQVNHRFAPDAFITRPLDLATYSTLLERSLRRWMRLPRHDRDVDARATAKRMALLHSAPVAVTHWTRP